MQKECGRTQNFLKMKKTLKFLRSLRQHNNREWFNDHKNEYLEVKNSVELLTQELLGMLTEIEPEAARLRVSDCTYRIYRDTRFSLDKTPYKTHIGIFMNPPGGKKAETAGYYLHIEPGQCMFCAGSYGLPSDKIRRQRQAIFDEIDEFRQIVESPEFSSLYSELGIDPVKTCPKGFPRDWKYVDYIKPRNFCATAFLSDEFMSAPDLVERLRPYMVQAKRYNDFINFPILDDGNGDDDNYIQVDY